MAEELKITAGLKEEKYRELVPQIEAVVEGETVIVPDVDAFPDILLAPV